MSTCVHLVKLCVGTDSVEELERWQTRGAARDAAGRPMHITRMWPRREDEVLAGGSLYWVFRGSILARQRILALEPVQRGDGVQRCGIVLDPALVRTEPVPRRAFQGWRYLSSGDAPRDLSASRANDDPLPPALSAALSELGVR